MSTATLAFLRHAKVPSHHGDMPLTEDSNADIEAAVPRLKALAKPGDIWRFLATETHRSRQTAEALRSAIDPSTPEVKPAWGLRNPDIHLAGSRVEMGSLPEFFASQCQFYEMAPEDVLAQSFYSGFLNAPDRIEYWVHHETPPGEDAAAVARRIVKFAESFLAVPGDDHHVVVCVTHSPVMRAILTKAMGMTDPGEPNWVEEIIFDVTQDGIAYRFRDHSGTI